MFRPRSGAKRRLGRSAVGGGLGARTSKIFIAEVHLCARNKEVGPTETADS